MTSLISEKLTRQQVEEKIGLHGKAATEEITRLMRGG